MAAPQKEEVKEEGEDWLTTYADAITLLMAFFVMMLTFAEFDIPAYEELSSALANSVGNRDQQTSNQSLKIDAQDIVYNMQADQVVQVGSDSKGVIIELQSNAFYKPGSAEIVPAAIPVLQKLAETLASPRYELYNVEVEGHTDDIPIKSQMFPSNWELSTARAATVVRLFGDNNVVFSRLKAAGFADTRPKVPNRDLEGKPIPENQATNRRVVLRLHPMSLDERDAYLRAQEFRDQQKRAAEAAKALAGPQGRASRAKIEDRLKIVQTPGNFSATQRATKEKLDTLKRDIIANYSANKRLSRDNLAKFKNIFATFAALRDGAVEPYFRELEDFFQQEEQDIALEAKGS